MDLERQALLLACSVTLAGGLQLLLPVVVLQRQGLGLVRTWRRGWPQVGQVFRAMVPVVIGMSLVQTSAMLDSFLAWGLAQPDDGGRALCELLGIPALMESGTASALYIGQRMYQFPLGVFGIALGTVLFPVLTQHAQRGEFELLRADLSRGLRLVIAIGLPASAGLSVLASPVANVLFRHGRFDAEDARLVARMIAIYGAGVWSYISLAILNRAFYAIGDRVTPMRLGMISLGLNILLNISLVFLIGGAGLAAGSVLASMVQVALTLNQLRKRTGPLDWTGILGTLAKGGLATLLMTGACLATIAALPDAGSLAARAASLAVPGLIGAAVYYAVARLLRMTELDDLLRRD